ncbi:hypothetical protein P4B35_01590 [Pontiellaceae bacterium B12227]|nr:hypothetical protein [Pontiellaceae bacterium B12227]
MLERSADPGGLHTDNRIAGGIELVSAAENLTGDSVLGNGVGAIGQRLVHDETQEIHSPLARVKVYTFRDTSELGPNLFIAGFVHGLTTTNSVRHGWSLPRELKKSLL